MLSMLNPFQLGWVLSASCLLLYLSGTLPRVAGDAQNTDFDNPFDTRDLGDDFDNTFYARDFDDGFDSTLHARDAKRDLLNALHAKYYLDDFDMNLDLPARARDLFLQEHPAILFARGARDRDIEELLSRRLPVRAFHQDSGSFEGTIQSREPTAEEQAILQKRAPPSAPYSEAEKKNLLSLSKQIASQIEEGDWVLFLGNSGRYVCICDADLCSKTIC